MQTLDNVYICGSPFIMSRTDAQTEQVNLFVNNDYIFSMCPQRNLQHILDMYEGWTSLRHPITTTYEDYSKICLTEKAMLMMVNLTGRINKL